MEIEKRLQELGYTLPVAPAKGGVYTPVKEFGENLAYVSGHVSKVEGLAITGKLGADCSFEDGLKASELCALNMLATIKAYLGDLDRIKSCVKMTVFVASHSDFYKQPQIANAATELLVKIMGEEKGCPSRSAIGVPVLPGNFAVEIEMMIEIEK